MSVVLERPRIHKKPEPARKQPDLNRLYTADELFELPSDFRCELIRGEIIPLPPSPGGEHGDLADSLDSRASVFVRDNNLGKCFAAETGFNIYMNPDTVRGPDWAFI